MSNIISQLQKILDRLADILLPKEKKVKYLEQLGPDGLFEKIPRAENFDFETDKFKVIFNYKSALCRQAIWEIKYRANKKLIHDFSLLLYEFILEELSDLETFHNFKNIILIPVPSSKSRVREKGFNQCQLICQELIRIDQDHLCQGPSLTQPTFTLAENLLIKKENTARQSKTKSRKERLENLRGTFSVIPAKAGIHSEHNLTPTLSLTKERGKTDLHNHSFILIDDVITTGATMAESVRALKEAGAHKIIGFALAH